MRERCKPLLTQVKRKFAYVTMESAAADSSSLIFCIYLFQLQKHNVKITYSLQVQI